MDIRLHFSLIVLLAYVVLAASMQFPYVVMESGVDPSSVGGTPFSWGLLFALALFVSVLLHEFGHVIAAQAMGVRVRSVTLMMLGGVSEMDRIPEKPYSEFKISFIGPIVSFILGGALMFLGGRAMSQNVAFFAYWVGSVNLMLGAFNLLPAFPLDGGRALRSLLAARWGMSRATTSAVRVAKGLAWVLGALAFLSFNFFLMLIAFFIYSAATGELVLSVSRGLLKGIPAGKIGTHLPALNATDTLEHAARRMFESRALILPVESQDGSTGVITAESIRKTPHDSWAKLKVSDFMVPVGVVEESALLDEVVPEIAAASVLPLADHGKVTGIVRYSDLAALVELRGLDRVPPEGPAAAA